MIFFLCSFLLLNLIIAVLWEKYVQHEEADKPEDTEDEELQQAMEEEEEKEKNQDDPGALELN